MRPLTLILLLVAVLGTSGCLDADAEWVLNPDGSGKVTQTLVYDMSLLKSLAPSARDFARGVLDETQGVEVWKDVSVRKAKDGKIHFKGVAYFKDASKVRLEKSVADPVFRREGDTLIVEVAPRSEGKGFPDLTRGPNGMPLDPASQQAVLRLVRHEVASMKGTLRGRTRVRLPGKTTHEGFAQTEHGLEAVVSVEKILEGLDALAKDPKAFAGGKRADERVFGKRPVARSTGGKPAFDYAQEVAAAHKASATTYGAFGTAPLGPRGKVVSLEVASLRYVHRKESDGSDLSFLSSFKPHTHLRLWATLDASALIYRGGRVTSAIASDGASVLFAERRAELKSLYYEEGKMKRVRFDVLTAIPTGPGGFKEISGYVEYLLPGRTKDVNLQFKALKAGAAGTLHGAKLKKVAPYEHHFGDGPRPMALSLTLTGIEASEIQAVEVRDAAGKALPTQIVTRMGFGKKLTVYLHVAQETLPAKGTIVLRVYATRTRHRAYFKLSQLDAAGGSR